ncbi:MAG: hypothetical protein D6798_09325 [Deltaproteobacteria bacterium]|nr:MAG: hypothetical protein D6798_09325 [Deltaproteobacteria bacterium]
MRSLPSALVLLLPATGCIIYTGDGFDADAGPPSHCGSGSGGPGGDQGGGFGGADTARYTGVAVEILEPDAGLDLDGDGDVDNNLPIAIDALSQALGGDRSWDPGAELQRLVEDGAWVPLMQVRDVEDGLVVGLLAGTRAEDGGLAVLPGSYDDAGRIVSVLHGERSRSGGFEAGPGPVRLPARLAGDVDIVLPLDGAMVVGRTSEDGAATMVAGVVPTELLIESALAPYLGADGLDIDGDGVADLSTEAVLDTVAELLDDPAVTDFMDDEGGRGISAAFWIDWEAADF